MNFNIDFDDSSGQPDKHKERPTISPTTNGSFYDFSANDQYVGLFNMQSLNQEINHAGEQFDYSQQDQFLLNHSYTPNEQIQQDQRQQNFLRRTEDEVDEMYNMINFLPQVSPQSNFSFNSNVNLPTTDHDMDGESITLENLLDDDSLFWTAKGSSHQLHRQESNDTILQCSSPMNGDGLFPEDEVLQSPENGLSLGSYYNKSNNSNNNYQSAEHSIIGSSTNIATSQEPPRQATFYNMPTSTNNSGVELVTTATSAKPKTQQRKPSQKKVRRETTPKQLQQNMAITPESDVESINSVSTNSTTNSFQSVFSQQSSINIAPSKPIQFPNSQLPLSIQLRHTQSQQTLKRADTTDAIFPSASSASLARSRSGSMVTKPNRGMMPQQQRYSSLIIDSSPAVSSSSPGGKSRRPSSSRVATPTAIKSNSAVFLNQVNRIHSTSSLSTNLTSSYATVKKSRSHLFNNPRTSSLTTNQRTLTISGGHYSTLDFSKDIHKWTHNTKLQSDKISAQGSDILKSKFSISDSNSLGSSSTSNGSKNFQFVIEDGLRSYNDKYKSASYSNLPTPASSEGTGGQGNGGRSSSFGFANNMTPASYKYAKISSRPSPYDHRIIPQHSSNSSLNQLGQRNRSSSSSLNTTFTQSSVKSKQKHSADTSGYKYQSIIYPAPSATVPPTKNNVPASQIGSLKVQSMTTVGYESSPNTGHSPLSCNSIRKRKTSMDSDNDEKIGLS